MYGIWVNKIGILCDRKNKPAVGLAAADFPGVVCLTLSRKHKVFLFIQYIQIRSWNKNSWAYGALNWEIGWFYDELFTHTCVTSPAKRADVTCQVKPKVRRPETLFNIPKTAHGPQKARIWVWIYSIPIGKNCIKTTRIHVDKSLWRHNAFSDVTNAESRQNKRAYP